ncbi:MAG: hypothetical protein R2780_05355 [Crocinitomicaceae bacterium]|nr:hypothetical protein [Crocinitomicaceae bacterium]
MERAPIPEEIFQELIRSCMFGGPGAAFFREKIGPFQLTDDQFTKLIEALSSCHTSALEYNYAKEAIDFLQNLKNRK